MRRHLLWLPFFLALAGCQKSAVNGSAKIAIDGKVLDAQGQPITAAVPLARFQAAVVGGSCIDLPTLQRPFKTATPDSTGAYHFDLLGSDTQTSAGDARCFEVATPGGKTRVAFTVQVDQVAVPTLQDWGDQLAASGTGGITLSWRSLNDAVGVAPKNQTLWITSASATSPGDVWQQTLTGDATQVSLPGYLLEDFAHTARVGAYAETKGSGVIFQVTYQGDSVPVGALGSAPPSRGASCQAAGATLGSPCPLTDGKLKTVTLGVSQLTVTLAAPILARHAVLRGLSANAPLEVEASSDGSHFETVGQLSTFGADGYFDVPLSGSQPAATYRFVATGQDPKINALSEVSLDP